MSITSQKASVSSLAFSGSRTAIERCRKRPLRGPTVIAWQIMDRVGQCETLPAKVKAEVLKTRPAIPPARKPLT